MSFKTAKRSMAAYKGHYTIHLKAFYSLSAVVPRPTNEAMDRSYAKVQERLEKLIDSLESAIALLTDETTMDVEKVDADAENAELLSYYEKVLQEQCEIEKVYVNFKSSSANNLDATPARGSQVTPNSSSEGSRATVRLTALDPPIWSGIKADFYTWQKKFTHIMSEAKIANELTQLCYLQNQKTLPPEYQVLVSDCFSIREVWRRLEERVPKETIKHEVINEFRKLRPLPTRRTSGMLREFANEVSLFCRRMTDLGYEKENYSCIIMRDVYERLNHDTVLRYRSKISLQRELGQNIEEDLDSLCTFLRSEATTLELSNFDSTSPISPKIPPSKKFYAMNREDDETNEDKDRDKCTLCSGENHRLIDCEKYMGMTPGERREFIKTSRRCFSCLSVNHAVRNCPRRREYKKCGKCGEGTHHWTTCLNVEAEKEELDAKAPPFQPGSNDQQNDKSHNYTEMSERNDKSEDVKLKPGDYPPLVLAEIKTGDGRWIRARCLLDTGSNSSLIRTQFARRNQLCGGSPCYVSFKVAGGGVHRERAEEWEFQIRAVGGSESYFVTATGVKKPCSDVKGIPTDGFVKYEHLADVQDKIFVAGGEVDILIGQDYAPLVVPERVLRAESSPDQKPSAAVTRLGYYLYGSLSEKLLSPTKQIMSINRVDKWEEEEMKLFFYGDVLGVRPTSLCVCTDNEISESAFIKHVTKTTEIDENGRVRVRMPWKPGYPEKLPNNFQKAKQQMVRRENQLVRAGKLKKYNEEIDKLLERGVVRMLTPEETVLAAEEPAWYLNHHMIERLDKNSTKLRLVWDSAAPFRGVCLNDAFEKGPVYINLLFRCLIRWRSNTIAVVGDIEKMFNQIAMIEDDQKYHRFLWRHGDTSLPVRGFQWLRVLFGDKPSPDLAAYAIKYLAKTCKGEYPAGASILDRNIYVDDIAFSVDDSVNANCMISEVDAILGTGKFKVKIWDSNSSYVDQNKDDVTVDVLDHRWNKQEDTISMKPKKFQQPEEKPFTKRSVTSFVAKGWDPYGYLLPITIKYRIALQHIWQKGFDWDDVLPDEMVGVWSRNIHEMENLVDIAVDRGLKPDGAIGKPQLHAFSDGGDEAFGTCVFIRWLTSKGIQIRFVAAKAFVAPLKVKSIPRLELMGAVAMCRLISEIEQSLDYDFEFKRFWIDSLTVIFWLMSYSSRYKAFVSTRIQEFQDTHENWRNELRHVPSQINPADCLTKSISKEQLIMWHQGTFHNFLELEEGSWPEVFDFDNINADSTGAMLEVAKTKVPSRVSQQKVINTVTNDNEDGETMMRILSTDEVKEETDFGLEIADQFSSWSRLLAAVAFLKKCFLSKSLKEDTTLNPESVITAEEVLFFICQLRLRQDVTKTKKRFYKYHPVVDDKGFVRAGGRLVNMDIPEETKHPLLLPGEHPLVTLYARYQHKKLLHRGYRVVLADMMKIGIVIGGGREVLKRISSKCMFCKVRRQKLLQQMMGNLPSFRAEIRKPPFSTVAIDFFGPLKVKQSRNVTMKASVLIITCTTTRCIHLELCMTIDTNSFLRAWRRFTTTRGVQTNHVFSDGATTFKGAYSPILEWIESWDEHLIRNEFPRTQFTFRWSFNVPTASHMNGVVESLINSVRKGLDAAIINYTKSILTFEEWVTILCEITYLINSRPLIPDGDPWEFHCITGNDIMHPYGQPQLPQFASEDYDNPRNMLKRAQGRVDVFWDTWVRHMPPQLNLRNKWFHSRENIEKGDFVIVLEKGIRGQTAPRSQWKKAVVTDVHPGTDGLVRSVTIRDPDRNEYIRPIHKLCLIATKAELEAE